MYVVNILASITICPVCLLPTMHECEATQDGSPTDHFHLNNLIS